MVGVSPSRETWNVVEYEGVRVDIPSTWARVDTGECEFPAERWAPPDASRCDFEEGVAFSGSATFDPEQGPGVRRTAGNGRPTWGGYTVVGDLAVYAAFRDRAVVRGVIGSARETG